MALKSYEEHMATKTPEVEGSGVACSDFVREKFLATITKSRSRAETRDDGTIEDVIEDYEVQEEQERNIAPCPGELMYSVPKLPHPQLADTHRVVCSVCGWRGWI